MCYNMCIYFKLELLQCNLTSSNQYIDDANIQMSYFINMYVSAMVFSVLEKIKQKIDKIKGINI